MAVRKYFCQNILALSQVLKVSPCTLRQWLTGKGLYVISKDTQRILVRELQGGSSSGPFDFIIYGFKTDDTGPPVIRSKMEKAVISPDTHVEYMGPPPVISNVNKLAMPKRPDHPRHPRHGNNVD